MGSSGDPAIEKCFPGLRPDDYEVTHPEDPSYNCIAWAAGKTDAWWEPIKGAKYYWPDDAPWDCRIDSLVRVFESLGFEVCESDALELGYEKVAIYGKEDEYTHAARQLPSGRWTSKLGIYKVIEHKTLNRLVGESYGSVVRFLRRPVQQPTSAEEPPS